jgi:large exoprotein involved in heme utilization and adhesion
VGENSQGFVSGVFSRVHDTAEGDSGAIVIETSSLSLTDGAVIDATTFGKGNAGAIEITASDGISLAGQNSQRFGSGIASQVAPTAGGNSGEIILDTSSLSLTDGAQMNASTFGKGNAGTIQITASDGISLAGEDNRGFVSGVFSGVDSTAEGNSGGIIIDTTSLSLRDGAKIDASTFGKGNAGAIDITASDSISLAAENSKGRGGSVFSQVNSTAEGNSGGIVIKTSSLSLTDGAVIDASTLGKGNAGAIEITAFDGISLAGEDSQGFVSGVSSSVQDTGEGNNGGIVINTSLLSLTDGATINASTLGKGNAGAIQIKASDGISLAGEDSRGFVGGVFSVVGLKAEGNSGGIVIDTIFLSLTNGTQINASTLAKGNAGAIQITVSDGISLAGEDSRGSGSGVSSQVEDTAEGNSGGIVINTSSLSLTDGAQISASTRGKGDAGAIQIRASDGITLAGENNQGFVSGVFSGVDSTAEGNSGGIVINTSSLSLTDGATINAGTFGRGNAGLIRITASNGITLAGEDSKGFVSSIVSTVASTAEGSSGGIAIDTTSLSLTDGAVIDASTLRKGNAGAIQITASNGISLVGENSQGSGGSISSTVENTAEGDSGEIVINTSSLSLIDGAQINASTFGKGNAGAIQIRAFNGITLAGKDSQGFVSGIFSTVDSTAEGNAGSIILNVPQLTLFEDTIITASTNGKGDGGNIIINSPQSILLSKDSTLSVETTGAGKPGDIIITTNTLTIGKDAQLSATVTATSTNIEGGGSITLNANNLNISGELGIFAETQSIAPAGNLIFKPYNTPNLNIQFTDNGFISASTSADGQGGNIFINVPQTLDIRGEGKIAVETSGKGNAGDIEITTQNLTLADGLEISASTTGEGNAGNVILKTEQLIVQDGARISSEAVGTGIGGDINIMADNLTLDRGTISAQTASTTGGNITLNLQNLLTLRNESQISTTAGTAQAGGDGGNITINAQFIVTSPFENSDITANAFLGNGGNINITTLGIFGLEVRETLTPFSDITASSEFGLDGEIDIDNLGIDPTRGIESLPQAVVNPQVFRGCQVREGEAISEFYRLGRGGLPSSPDDWLNEAPFGDEGLIPLEMPLDEMPINWQEVPTDSVSFSCQSL